MRSKAGMVRKGKLKRHSDSEANATAANVSVKASLPSLQGKPYPSLGLRFPSNLGGNSCSPHLHSQ